jgi:hypothetical protein
MRNATSSQATTGLPWFSTSSSKRSARNIVAQPIGALFLLAKPWADRRKRKMPPVRPSASRAIQSPRLLRPIKNSGIVSLRTPESGRRGNLVLAPAKASDGRRRSWLGWAPVTTRQMPRRSGRWPSIFVATLVTIAPPSGSGDDCRASLPLAPPSSHASADETVRYRAWNGAA